MKKLIAIMLAACCLVGCARQAIAPSPFPQEYDTAVAGADEQPPLPVLKCIYYEQHTFFSALASPQSYEFSGDIRAGMVPHHLLASDMITGFFGAAADMNYDRVIIVAPSHFPERCRSDVVTALADWETPFGKVTAARDIIENILADKTLRAENNPAAVEFDHGVAGLVPFVKYYFPDAEVAVCLLANKLSQERLAQAVQLLGDAAAEGRTLLLASIDCSHYLGADEAEIRDRETTAAIEAFDYEKIRRFNDSNVDSPQTLEVLLRYIQREGLSLAQLDNSGSQHKLPYGSSHPAYADGVTSYMVYAAGN